MPQKPAVQAIVFDVNGTLLDTGALKPMLRAIFGSKLTVEAWFTELLQVAAATSLAGDFRPFGELAAAVLHMAAAAHRVPLKDADVERVRTCMRRLPPFPEVKRSLLSLRQAGFRLAVLSNSDRATLAEQIAHAGLEGLLDQTLSVEVIQRYKPAVETYHVAARALGVHTSEMMMVAAHAWDLMGASRAGCETAFIARPGKSLLPGVPRPTYVARNLKELATQIVPRRRSGHRGLILASVGATALGIVLAAPRRNFQWPRM